MEPVTALFSSIQLGQVELVEKALNAGADRNGKDEEGVYVIHHAVQKGNKEILETLLKGADPNPTDKDGKTPLIWAAESNGVTAVKCLLAAQGIDPNLGDKSDKTALAWASQCGNDKVVKLLLGWDGIDINAKDDEGSTPLLWAACRGRNAVVKILLGRKDIKPNEKDNTGMAPLSWAAQRGWKGPVKTLLAWPGIDANTQDNEGSTPLLWAACRGQPEAAQLLLAYDGIEPDLSDEKDRTPLSWAAERGYDAVIRLLVSHKGVNVNSTDEDDSTPLLWAACRGHEAAVRVLLGAGADWNIGDKDDLTPLDWAKSRGYEVVVGILEQAAEDSEFEKKMSNGKSGDSESSTITLSNTQQDPSPLAIRLKSNAYLFDDQISEFSQSKIIAADNWIQEYTNLLKYTIEPMLASQSSDTDSYRVKVAVLDSGLDWTNPFIRGMKAADRIKGYKNFAGDREDQQKANSVDDDFGHGTHVTALLLKTSLAADVYIARVASGGKLGDPEHVAEAIKWASDDCKVDIISMSLGFDRVDPVISETIKHAHAQDVIMFAAAANHGGNKSIAFPASLQHMVLGINSTDGLGNPSPFNPTPEALRENFSVLGEAVTSQWPKKLDVDGSTTKCKSGTSFATPIAAGIAATLLHYAKVKFPKSGPSERFGSLNRMRAMLWTMATKRADYAYLHPVSFFTERAEELVHGMLYDGWVKNI